VELLRQIRERDPGIPVIILTGEGSLESAMEVIAHGGFRYLTKPFEEQAVLAAVRAASAVRAVDLLRRRAIEICDSGAWRAAAGRDLDEHFSAALKNLFVVYQPIIDVQTDKIFGFEALVRSKGPELTNPALLFGAAERLGRVRDIGKEVRRLVATQIQDAPKEATLFVNLHALDLGDEELYAKSAPLSRVSHRVILEITERMSLDTVDDLAGRISSLRDLGYRVAVDDLGAGYAGLTSFSELTPEVVKLDMSLVRDIDQSPRKQSIVGSLLTVCLRDLDTRVVCEGVETSGERDTLVRLGADLLQGYLLGRPVPEFPRI
jgi:EAL domain-containing protein (putative c-di-GMP-specific phosphodiesterase class I)